jgi:DNA-directed RNA polymerase subunit RPC12/RpoP
VPPKPPSPTRLIGCSCLHCGKRIDFPELAIGDTIQCPHCGRQTMLHRPVSSATEPPTIDPPKQGPQEGKGTGKRNCDLVGTPPTPPNQGGMTCPHCGSHSVGKVRGLQGMEEVSQCAVLLLLFLIPGIIFYIYMESVPYCSGCGRRVRAVDVLSEIRSFVKKRPQKEDEIPKPTNFS